tara:strand:- start:605 stop:730 length:126 start_codon:yes stop_codon:yes gene_type:complete
MVLNKTKRIGWCSNSERKINLPLLGSESWQCVETVDLFILD